MVNTPTVIGTIRLNTYGTLEIGDVPRFAFMEKATPMDIINRPVKKIKYLLTYSVFINAFSLSDYSVKLKGKKAVPFVSGKIWNFPNPNYYVFQSNSVFVPVHIFKRIIVSSAIHTML
jgi:hypothetical protein